MFHLKYSGRGISTREIVILVVLTLALIFGAAPFYFQQKRDALRIASANNLQQWGIALNLYLIENGSRLPEVGMPLEGPVNDRAWYNALPPYISQMPYTEIVLAERPRPGKASIWMDPFVDEAKALALGDPFFTYAMNRWLQPKWAEPSYKIFDLADPSGVIFLTDAASGVPAIKPDEVRLSYTLRDSSEKAAHVLFCDGHVELVGQAELIPANANDSQQALGKVNWIPFFQAPPPE